MKNIKVNYSQDNSVKVNIYSSKMAPVVDQLIELDGKTFRKLIKVARMYRRAGKAISNHYADSDIKMRLSSPNKEALVVNDLVYLGDKEFKKAIRCAKRIRRANHIMDQAEDEYEKIQECDNALLIGSLAYE